MNKDIQIGDILIIRDSDPSVNPHTIRVTKVHNSSAYETEDVSQINFSAEVRRIVREEMENPSRAIQIKNVLGLQAALNAKQNASESADLSDALPNVGPNDIGRVLVVGPGGEVEWRDAKSIETSPTTTGDINA